MRFLLVTSNASAHLRPVQNYLFDKYMSLTFPEYIDMKDYPLSDWCKNVLKYLENIKDEFVVFGLDDFLVTNKISSLKLLMAQGILINGGYERFELGYAYRSFNRDILVENMALDGSVYLTYPTEAIYSVSCQYSIWRTSALRRVLAEVNSDPWKLETQGKCSAACFPEPVFEYIEESALSKRWGDKINVRGMKKEDVDYLINNGMLDKEKLINHEQ